MRKLKVMTIVGTRPEIIKLSRVIAELEKHMHHILVHTGQNFDHELNGIFINELKIKKPDYLLNVSKHNAAETIGNVIINIDKVLEKEKPDAVLIYGDTNSCLGIIAAKRRQIPIFHMEAGNRCYDQRVPEEINRKIIDHISDINMTLSEHARNALLKEGLPAERIFKIGSSMQEVFNYYKNDIEFCLIHQQLKLNPYEYFLISLHREENINSKEKILNFLQSLNMIASTYKKDIIVSTHPRTRILLDELSASDDWPTIDPYIKFMKPFGFIAYTKLQLLAYCILSDSGSLMEDANLLNLPAVMLRQMHERPEGIDKGTLVMSKIHSDNVLHAISMVLAHHETGKRHFDKINDYDVNNISKKVVRIILSYIDYVNTNVWYKNI